MINEGELCVPRGGALLISVVDQIAGYHFLQVG